MPLLNYTTTIAAHTTVAEIQQMLAKAGANAILSEYDDDGYIVALSFTPTSWLPRACHPVTS